MFELLIIMYCDSNGTYLVIIFTAATAILTFISFLVIVIPQYEYNILVITPSVR